MWRGIMAKKKENLIKKNVLLKYEYDREGGNVLINDFLQLNKIVLQDGCKERGKKKK